MISKYCKKLKYKREIVLVTNGTGLMAADGLEEIKTKVQEDGIKITILWVEIKMNVPCHRSRYAKHAQWSGF